MNYNSAISLEGVSKVFLQGFFQRKVKVLHDLTLTINSGEIFGYLGPNGAGKTTTIKILTHLLKPTEGNAWILGLPVHDENARKKIGYLPEQPYFYHHLTAREFLLYCGSLAGMKRKESRKSAGELLERLGLEKHGNISLRNYSRGMLQRVGLAQALIHDPQLIIMDEPLEGLDPIGRRLVKDMILELKTRGKTVFFSSHILEDIEAICSRIAIIVRGRLRESDTIEHLLSKHLKNIEIQVLLNKGDGAEDLKKQFNCVLCQGNRLSFSVQNEEDLYPIIKAIRNRNGKIVSIQPKRATLEEIFLKRVMDEQ